MNDSTPSPAIHPTARVAEGAVVRGHVTLGENVSVWYNAVLRGDVDAIEVGNDTNIQDGCIVHEDFGCPARIGRRVTVGHGAILHGCTVGDDTLIGMGAIVLNGARIGAGCIVGAGALVTQGTVVPDGSVVLGSPVRIVRQVTTEELEHNRANAQLYVDEARSQLPTASA